MGTIKGILYVVTIYFCVLAVGEYYRGQPHIVAIEPNAQAVSANDLRGGCAKGSVYNVTGTITEEHSSISGDPIAEMKIKHSEFTVRVGFPEPRRRIEGLGNHILGIYVGAHVTVQGTCYSSAPGLYAYLRESKVISK